MTARPGGSPTVAAVVVNYNAASHLADCLASLRAGGASPVVVVDNASTDGSSRVVADSGGDWVEMGANSGYGRAANRGAASVRAGRHEYLVVCNPDVVVNPGALEGLVAALEADPSLGLVGPRIVNPDGSLYPSARAFPDLLDALGHAVLGLVAPGNRYTRRYRLLDWDHGEPAPVDWVSGAFFVVRRAAWEAVGGFDPRYFMYMEDVDLCWRLGQAGWAVWYEPSVEVVHVQGVSADLHPYRMIVAHHVSMWRFARRTTRGARRALLPAVAGGIAGRLVLAVAHRRISAGWPRPVGLGGAHYPDPPYG